MITSTSSTAHIISDPTLGNENLLVISHCMGQEKCTQSPQTSKWPTPAEDGSAAEQTG